MEVVDEDLGRSGSGLVARPGFQRVVAMVCAGHVGAILCIELRLAKDLPAVWNASTTDMRLKQRIVRILVEEIVADVDESANQVVLVLRWAGGRHSELRIAKNKTGHHRRVTDPEVIETIRQMAGQYSDEDVMWPLDRRELTRPC